MSSPISEHGRTHRQLLYVPEIRPDTFLLFYHKGPSDRSYSFRDYSSGGAGRATYASQYPRYSATDILRMARHRFDAPTHATGDVEFWAEQVRRLNEEFLSSSAPSAPAEASPPTASRVDAPAPKSVDLSGVTAEASAPSSRAGSPPRPGFPTLALRALLAHPVKAAKHQDVERILFAGRSEDWVTWNVLQLLSLLDERDWWPDLLALARLDNPHLSLDPDDPPLLDAWVPVSAPAAYERRSRERMAASDNPEWVARARDPRPVEGTSEIDLVLTSRGQLGFVEAKLTSDISSRTTYDPERNQIVRNIDCLLERAGDRTPFFWMLAADREPGRAYTQAMQRYREDPEALAAELPHRPVEAVASVARKLATVQWKDLLGQARKRYEAVWDELRARVEAEGS